MKAKPHLTKRKPVLAIAILAAFALLSIVFRSELSLAEIQSIAQLAGEFTARHPAITFFFIALAQALGMAFALPSKALLNLLAGAMLGVLGGSLATLLGVLSGTTALFFAARYWLAERLERNGGYRLKAVAEAIAQKPIRTMIGLRLFIALPYGPCTVTAALTPMRYRDFLIGTLLGDLPVIALYSLAAERLFALTTASSALSPAAVVILLALGFAFLLAAFLSKKRRSAVNPVA